MKPSQAARRLVEDIQATFDFDVSSGSLADTTKEVLQRSTDVLNNLIQSHERTALLAQRLDKELDAAVKSRISFSSIGSMTLWPSSYAPEKATLEHLVQENKELRQQIDSSQINMSYSKMLKYFDEHTTVYVAPDRELAKRCTQLAAENERQAAQIATLSTQLSDSASASHAMHERQWHPGSGLQRQSQAKGTQDLSGNQQASTAYKAAPIKTDLQGEPPFDILCHEEILHQEGRTDQIASGHASQAVPRSRTRMTVASELPCQPPSPAASRDPACLHHPMGSPADSNPHHPPTETRAQQAEAPQRFSAFYATPAFNPLPSPAGHCCPFYPPHVAASRCDGYHGHPHSRSSITRNSGHANYPSNYPYPSSYEYDSSHVYDTYCPVRAGYSDSGYPCHDHDYGMYAASSNADDYGDGYGDGWSVSAAYSADSDYADHAYDDYAYDDYAYDDYGDGYGDSWSVSAAYSADSDYAEHAYDDYAYDDYAYDDYAYDDYGDGYGDSWSVSAAYSADSDCADHAHDDYAYDDVHDAGAVHSNNFYPTWNQQHLPREPASSEAHLGDHVPVSHDAAGYAYPAESCEFDTATQAWMGVASSGCSVVQQVPSFPQRPGGQSSAPIPDAARTPHTAHTAQAATTYSGPQPDQHLQQDQINFAAKPATAFLDGKLPRRTWQSDDPFLPTTPAVRDAHLQRHTLSSGAPEVETPHAFQSCMEMEMVQSAASDPVSNTRLALPDVDFEFAGADLSVEAETPRLFLHSTSTATPADTSCQSCVPQGSSNSQPFTFFGVDFATLCACKGTAQQAIREPAPSALENSLTEQQCSEQPQDVSKAADDLGSNIQVCNNDQGVAGSACSATELGIENPLAHQCNNSFTDCTSSFTYFGLDPATLQACSVTAQQASNKATSLAAKITHTEQASTGACTIQTCAAQIQASTHAVSSSPPAAWEATLNRARPLDCTSSFIHFGVDTATLGSCRATAQQASDKAASSAPGKTHTKQASSGACTTQACNTTSQAAPLALSSRAAAAQEEGFSRAGPSPALPSRRRQRHRASTLSAAAPARTGSTAYTAPGDSDTSCQAALAPQGNSLSCRMSSAGNPSLQRSRSIVAGQLASSRNNAQLCGHRPALPAGQVQASPQLFTYDRQAGTGASLAVRRGRNGRMAVLTDGAPLLDCTDRLQPTARVEPVQQSQHKPLEPQHAPADIRSHNAQALAASAASQPSHGRNHARNAAYRKRRRQRMQGSASNCS
ncbi:hypothetical protein ABBQ32_001959 [Trebouxia sp. C0010 RCD-2024]